MLTQIGTGTHEWRVSALPPPKYLHAVCASGLFALQCWPSSHRQIGSVIASLCRNSNITDIGEKRVHRRWSAEMMRTSQADVADLHNMTRQACAQPDVVVGHSLQQYIVRSSGVRGHAYPGLRNFPPVLQPYAGTPTNFSNKHNFDGTLETNTIQYKRSRGQNNAHPRDHRHSEDRRRPAWQMKEERIGEARHLGPRI